MNNLKHLYKVAAAWVSIVYVVCYVLVAAFLPLRGGFMRYAVHAQVPVTTAYLGLGNFIIGLIIWNVVVFLGVWLYAYLDRTIKK